MNPVGKMTDIEPIYAALFDLIRTNGVIWTDEDGNDAVVETFSRVPVPVNQIAQTDLPVVFLEEKAWKIEPSVATIGGRYKYTLPVDLVVILANNGQQEGLGEETRLPTRELNRAMIATVGAIQPPYPGAKQNLGGLVDSVYAEGRVERIVGLPGQGVQLSVGIIPVTILTI